jgi:hypothetical protein
LMGPCQAGGGRRCVNVCEKGVGCGATLRGCGIQTGELNGEAVALVGRSGVAATQRGSAHADGIQTGAVAPLRMAVAY